MRIFIPLKTHVAIKRHLGQFNIMMRTYIFTNFKLIGMIYVKVLVKHTLKIN